MTQLLQPSSAINDLRTQAHLTLSKRLQALDLTQLLIYTLKNVPSSILPYLAWQFNMTVPAAAMQTLGVPLLTIVQNALPLFKIAGTKQSILNALNLCGYSGVVIQEGQASWGGSSYPASQGWAVFRVDLGGAYAGVLYSQAPSGVINGSNVNFTMPGIPSGTSLRVFYNGLLQVTPAGYSSSGTTLTMVVAPRLNSFLGVALRTNPLSGSIIANLTQIINFFKPARCLLDSVVANYPLFFDSVQVTGAGLTLALPQIPTSLELYRNGAYQTQGIDFTVASSTVTLTKPKGADTFVVWGTYAGAGVAPNFVDGVAPAGVIDGFNKIFTLPQAPNPVASMRLYLNGQCLNINVGGDYTVVGTTLTYTKAPKIGYAHLAYFRY